MSLGAVEIHAPRQLVLDALHCVKEGSALDLGAGYGRHSLLLASKGFKVTAVEPQSEMLKSLKQKAEKLGVSIRAKQADVRNFDGLGEEYDLVLSTMVLHFLSNHEEAVEAIDAMQKMTAKGGVNVICAYTDKSQTGLRPYLLNAEELRKSYSTWEILAFNELEGADIKIDGSDKGKKVYRVELIARNS